jgi:branched-chain amino acid transport system permease protein
LANSGSQDQAFNQNLDAKSSTKGSEEILIANQVLMQFGGLKALNQVDLRVKRGEIHGLIGPNGSGKSTMMNVLTGIYTPTAGEIDFKTQTVIGKTSSEIALSGIARTFQNVQLFGEMTALQNVLVGLHHTFKSNFLDVSLATSRYQSEDTHATNRAHALLDFVGLGNLAWEQARNLPYGKQRLLEIARALALDPELLLLDEPSLGLAPSIVTEMFRVIQAIHHEGKSVLLVEQNVSRALSISSRTYVLENGHVVAQGESSQLAQQDDIKKAYLGL